ncbi:MAG TPA: DUF3488 and transglutaminase-like domain-containing protein [Acidobacteriota bacterium]|nr:DUF3488 and transglutaminase-like domain-containing protein [Acidobacteriota bacterium]
MLSRNGNRYSESAWSQEQTFQLATCLLFLCGFATLVVSQAVSLALGLMVVPLVFFSYKMGPRPLSLGRQVLLLLAVVLFMLLDYLLLSSFVEGTVHLLLLAGLLKLYGRSNDKDYSIVYLISLGFLLVASAYTISAVFLASLMIWVTLAIFTLLLFESRRAYRDNAGAAFSLTSYLKMTAGVALLIALIAIPIFVLIPRTSLGFFPPDHNPNQQLSGFSDHVNLGDLGRIIENSATVMRVQVDRPPGELPPDLKWRGITLSGFTGRGWVNPSQNRDRLRWSEEDQIFLVPRSRRSQEDLLRQRVVTELPSPMVFGASPAVALRSGARFQRFFYDQSLNLYRASAQPGSYTVFSDLISHRERINAARQGRLPDRFMRPYLQLPPNLNSRIRDLAQDISFGERSDLGKALLIEEYLRGNYGYSLENRSALADDPLTHFLFVGLVGHCEFFATAQAVMMRTLGIPSRVVNGFRKGEYNEWSGHFVVRQSDAHSWAEGYFPGAGWVEFDPTPPAPVNASSYPVRMAGQLLQALDIFWSEIVTFDQMKQIGLIQSVIISLRRALIWLLETPQALKQLLSAWWKGIHARYDLALQASFWLLLLSLAAWTAYRYRRYLRAFLKKRILGSHTAEIAPEYYLEMLDLLERKGLPRESWETPAEFAARVGRRLGSAAPSRITQLYYSSRYGRQPLSEEDFSLIQESLRSLRALA